MKARSLEKMVAKLDAKTTKEKTPGKTVKLAKKNGGTKDDGEVKVSLDKYKKLTGEKRKISEVTAEAEDKPSRFNPRFAKVRLC